MTYVFPATRLDTPDRLADMLGGFWTEIYGGRQLVSDILFSRAQITRQSWGLFEELLACQSRLTVPIHSAQEHRFLGLNESARDASDRNLITYTGSRTYSTGSDLDYGEAVTQTFVGWELPEGIVDIAAITNRLQDPTLIWVNGVDFYIEDGVLLFYLDPFDANFAVTEVLEDSETVDRRVALWLRQVQTDLQYTWKQFGHVTGYPAFRSSANYRRAVNAVYDAMVEGSTRRNIEDLLWAAADVPCTQAEETIERIASDSRHLWIVTNQAAYRQHVDAVASVSVGDTVPSGTFLTDAVQVFTFGRGQTPTADQLAGLAVGRDYLVSGLVGDLVFDNADVALEVATASDGYTRLSWALGGFPGDVETFFDSLHARGVAADQTLAMLLDQRSNPVGQPAASHLPETINPLQLLCENVLRSHVTVVKIKTALSGREALGSGVLTLLRKVLPPHTALWVVFELTLEDEADGEVLTASDGATLDVIVMDSVIDESATNHQVFSKFIRGHCV